MEKLLIVDGLNLLFQMFYGMPARIVNKDGKAIHGVLGFIGALNKIIKMTAPTHLVALFDGEHPNPRAELLADYKGNRVDYSQVPEEDSPFSQLGDVYSALTFMGVKHTEVQEFEADDTIASYAYTYGQQMPVVIASFDSDFFQLISDNVKVLRYRGKHTALCDAAYIKERLDIAPCQYADFKSLTGDPSDNIKGAYRVGPKTSARLLHDFGSLEGILANTERILKPALKAAIIESAARLPINYRLIKLDSKAPIPFLKHRLRYTCNGMTTNHILSGIGLR